MQILKSVFILFVFAFATVNAQTSFFKVYSSGNFDLGEGICQLPDSSYLITGASGGFQTTSPQAFVMKIDKFGNQLWTKDFGGVENETGRRIFYIQDTIYVFGRTNSFGNSYDYYFLKLDSLGNKISEEIYGTNELEWLQDVIYFPTADCFITYGYEQESNGFGKKMQLLKWNRNGQVIWNGEESMHLEAELGSLRKITDSTFFVCGSQFNLNRNHFDGYFKQLNVSGQVLDSVTYFDVQDRDYFFASMDWFDDRYFIVGNETVQNGSAVNKDYKAWKYIISTHQIEISNAGVGVNHYTSFVDFTRLNGTTNELVAIERAKSSTFGIYEDGNWDEQLLKINAVYDFNWAGGITNVSKLGNDVTNQLISTLDGGAIMVGYNEYYSNFTQNVSVLKIGRNGEAVTTGAIPGEENLLKLPKSNQLTGVSVYPNPVKNFITIDSQEDVEVSIFQIDGRLVGSFSQPQIDMSEFTNGIYLLKLQAGERSSTFQIVKE